MPLAPCPLPCFRVSYPYIPAASDYLPTASHASSLADRLPDSLSPPASPRARLPSLLAALGSAGIRAVASAAAVWHSAHAGGDAGLHEAAAAEWWLLAGARAGWALTRGSSFGLTAAAAGMAGATPAAAGGGGWPGAGPVYTVFEH